MNLLNVECEILFSQESHSSRHCQIFRFHERKISWNSHSNADRSRFDKTSWRISRFHWKTQVLKDFEKNWFKGMAFLVNLRWYIFTNEWKIGRTRPASPLRFTFDDNLVDDTSGKLLPNKLTVDNLTIDWLRSRLNELETSLKTTQLSRQTSQQAQENNADTKPHTLDYSREREELRLRCQEKKLQRQAEVIRAALNELGCEELPSGCDLSMEGSFTEPPPIMKVEKLKIPQNCLQKLEIPFF